MKSEELKINNDKGLRVENERLIMKRIEGCWNVVLVFFYTFFTFD